MTGTGSAACKRDKRCVLCMHEPFACCPVFVLLRTSYWLGAIHVCPLSSLSSPRQQQGRFVAMRDGDALRVQFAPCD